MSEYRKQFDTNEELSRWYDAKYTEMGDGWVTPVEDINEHLDDLGVEFDQSKSLLDIGCGAGHFLLEAQKRVQAMGVEISDKGLELCARRGVNAIRYDIGQPGLNDLKFRDEHFDYIVSLGSLEHVIDLGQALGTIARSLKSGGKFYFFCPNEKYKHFDQPNERTMTDQEWVSLFQQYGLYPFELKRWNDSTALIGGLDECSPHYITPRGNKLNAGSGQRPFDTAAGWINLDAQARWNPDVVGDWNDLSMFKSDSMELVVAHQTIEHVGCGECGPFIKEAWRVLKPGGSLIVTVPDMKAICRRWVMGTMDTQLFMTNVYGAYMGEEGDRHRWGFDTAHLYQTLKAFANWSSVRLFDWRQIPGSDIAQDWWILGLEARK